MGDDGDDFGRTVVLDGLRGFGQGAAGVGHVVDEDRDLVRDVSDKDHAADFVGARAFLVDQRKTLVDAVRDGGSSGNS